MHAHEYRSQGKCLFNMQAHSCTFKDSHFMRLPLQHFFSHSAAKAACQAKDVC